MIPLPNNFFVFSQGTSGEWILAYQADQKRRLHAIVTAAVAHSHQHPGSRLSVPKNTPAYSARYYARTLTKESLVSATIQQLHLM